MFREQKKNGEEKLEKPNKLFYWQRKQKYVVPITKSSFGFYLLNFVNRRQIVYDIEFIE